MFMQESVLFLSHDFLLLFYTEVLGFHGNKVSPHS